MIELKATGEADKLFLLKVFPNKSCPSGEKQ